MGRKTCTEPQCLYKGALYLYLLPYPFIINMDPIPSALKMEEAGSAKMSGLTYISRWCVNNSDSSLDSKVI
jgi:hypothetical protein